MNLRLKPKTLLFIPFIRAIDLIRFSHNRNLYCYSDNHAIAWQTRIAQTDHSHNLTYFQIVIPIKIFIKLFQPNGWANYQITSPEGGQAKPVAENTPIPREQKLSMEY